jgi:Alpha-tubulin suppressor and related RCC1 domain-containing proteins
MMERTIKRRMSKRIKIGMTLVLLWSCAVSALIPAESASAAPIDPIKTKAIYVREDVVVAIKTDGTLAIWGNLNQQRNIPAGLTDVVSVAIGKSHVLALQGNGNVVGWGDNMYGQRSIPAEATNVIAIAAANDHSLALRADGTVVSWGRDAHNVITNLPADLTDVVAIATGLGHSLALKRNGSIVGWGNDPYGNLNVPAMATNVVAIASSDAHSLALKEDGTVVAWGVNGDGQATVPAGLTNVIAIAAGDNTSLAVKSDGTVVAWGDNERGQADVPAGLTQVTSVAGGRSHSLALKSDGTLVKWGGTNNYFDVPGSANLNGLTVDEGVLSPSFTSSGTSYTQYVGASVTGFRLTATLSSSSYQALYINDQLQTSGSPATIVMPDFSTTVRVRVEPYFLPAKTYTIDVWRDSTLPSIQFSANGSDEPSRTIGVNSVTVSDTGSGLDTASLQYAWSQSTSAPATASEWTDFSLLPAQDMSAPIVKSDGDGYWYLHVRAKDLAGNSRTVTSNSFLLDNTPPAIDITMKKADDTPYSENNWTNQDVIVSAAVTDATSVTSVTYSTNGGTAWYPYTVPFHLQEDGVYNVKIKALDAVGNENTVSRTAQISKSGLELTPTMKKAADDSDYTSGEWTNSDVHVSAKAEWGVSGLLALTYALDGAAEQNYSNESLIPFAASGMHTIAFKLTDHAGNSLSAPLAVNIDKTAPTADWSENGREAWAQIARTVVTINDTGGSDIVDAALKYAWTTEATAPTAGWTPFDNGAELIKADGDGDWYLHLQAQDRAGNALAAAAAVSNRFRLDNTGPSIDLIMSTAAGEPYADSNWTNQDVTIAAIATDASSGIQSLSYSLDGGATWEDYTAPLVLQEEGAHVAKFKAVDALGHEAIEQRSVNIDKTAPVITLNGSSSMNLTQGRAYVEAGATATDAGGSGVAGEVAVTGTVNTNTVGTYSLQYNVRDFAGNTAAETVRTVRVVSPPGGGGGSTPEPIATNLLIDLNGEPFDPADIDISKPSVTLEIEPKNVTAYASIPLNVMTSLADKNAAFYIEIKTPYGSYRIPVNLASLIPELASWLAANHLQAEDISFKITLTDKSGDKTLQAALANGLPKGKIIGAIVDYHLEIVNTKTGATIGTANQFSKALTRLIPLPRNVTTMPQQWGAFRYNDKTQKFEFVPARMERIEGVGYVTISSYSNSVYVAAENAVSFADVQKGWAQPFVELAAAKGLVEGVGGGRYDPGKSVTRAEFTVMLVRALGRGGASANYGAASAGGNAPYRDIGAGTWYADAVAKAKALGLLDFAKGDAFKPNQALTREEMASMLAAAIRLEKPTMAQNASDASLQGFKDIGSVSASDLQNIHLITKLRIMTGTSETTFSPKGATTRAQAATVFIRILKALGSID